MANFRGFSAILPQDVEDVLTTYTHENKSASVFLGAKKSKSQKVKKSNTTQIEPIEPASSKPLDAPIEPPVEERKTRKDTVPSAGSYSPYVKTGQSRSRSTSIERKHQRSSSTDSNNNNQKANWIKYLENVKLERISESFLVKKKGKDLKRAKKII